MDYLKKKKKKGFSPQPLQQDASGGGVLGLCQSRRLAVNPVGARVCHFQAAGSNMIRCRKDGNWTGSFRLCPNSRGQCSLPQNLHYSLQYSCKQGHGIGQYAKKKITKSAFS